MDAELDTGNTLVQGPCRSRTTTSRSRSSARSCWRTRSRAPARARAVAAGDPGDLQPTRERLGGDFEDDDYVRVDWNASARSIHNQVRAWHLEFGSPVPRAAVAELNGEQVVLRQTRLTDPGGGAGRAECGDAPIWVVASEPL